MSGDVHVRFCERLGGRFPGATRLVLFAPDKPTLWKWKRLCVERLARLRLTIHERQSHVQPVGAGIPWLGFVVFPEQRRVKGRKVRFAGRRLAQRQHIVRRARRQYTGLDQSHPPRGQLAAPRTNAGPV